MRAGHVVGVCPVLSAQIAALVGADALAAVEYLYPFGEARGLGYPAG